ncbi:glycosyltransferase family 2 protein [Asticcacaulis sp. AC402]|uniref:glycosyltransferase family 2 protein n=1 Tax=Asticcacaulis sp. AC402 TaxID=1282361 RepID=UPI0003C3C99B|nr:glycosyltransferase [Asticcacaulis sp. AC402]ESQ73620.1 hypothetical protein ABAC402_18180 [Asticcacaulis sp. AC402]
MISDYNLEKIYTVFDEEAYVFVTGWTTLDELPFSVLRFTETGATLKLDGIAYHDREDVVDYLLGFGLSPDARGFVARCSITFGDDLRPTSGFSRGRVAIDGSDSTFEVEVQKLDRKKVNELPFHRLVAEQIGSLMATSPLEQFLLKAMAGGELHSGPASIHLDAVGLFDGVMTIIDGWCPDVSLQKLSLCNLDDFSLHELTVYAKPRPDVSTHLKALGLSLKTNTHGFIAWTRLNEMSGNYVVIADGPDGVFATPLNLEGRGNTSALGLDLAGHVVRQICEERPDDLAWFFDATDSPLRQRKDIQQAIEKAVIYDLVPATEKTEVSIVVPFYGTDFFLLDIVEMQQRSPQNFQWVVVCDDRSLFSSMKRFLTHHARKLTKPVKLVQTMGESGFATASNVGAHYGDGNKILFMNSDAYVRDYATLVRGVEVLREKPGSVIGFTLLFEDNTIQHLGIQFLKSDSYAGLVLADHIRKGLHYRHDGIKVRPVTAVTGAMMLVDKQAGTGIEYFDSSFINGDFEDVDLCLQRLKDGHEVLLVDGPGVYHLERQSIGLMGGGARAFFTLKNSKLFSHRWEDFLASRGDLL